MGDSKSFFWRTCWLVQKVPVDVRFVNVAAWEPLYLSHTLQGKRRAKFPILLLRRGIPLHFPGANTSPLVFLFLSSELLWLDRKKTLLFYGKLYGLLEFEFWTFFFNKEALCISKELFVCASQRTNVCINICICILPALFSFYPLAFLCFPAESLFKRSGGSSNDIGGSQGRFTVRTSPENKQTGRGSWCT